MRALILAGGTGTRFWPLSRRSRPKQLLALDGETTLLRATVDRLAPLVEPADVWICTTERLADAVRAELPEVPAEQVLAEPEGRNTAPAIGWSIRRMAATDGGAEGDDGEDDVVAVLPADHRFDDAAAFRRVLERAAVVVRATDRVMALGVRPRWAETGYGYLELGAPLGDRLGDAGEAGDAEVYEVATFREKPDRRTAERWLAGGRHLWNAGIFVFRGATLLRHLERFEPEIADGLRRIAEEPERTAEIYPELKSTSIDYAVMERLPEHDAIATVPLEAGWSDLGSWQALDDVLSRRAEEHLGAAAGDDVTHGDVLALDAGDNLLWADEGTIAVIGVDNLVVVRTGDSVLVMPKERSQDVKKLVERLKADGRDDLL